MVFYNGREEQPVRQVQSLSEAFETPMPIPELELRVTVININADQGDRILEECRDLWEYSQFIKLSRSYAENMPIEQAVEQAVDESIRLGILAEFLAQNKAEAIKVSIYEYNQEKHFAALKEEGYENGFNDGFSDGSTHSDINNVKNLMNTLHFTLEQAMDALLIPEVKRTEYTEIIQKGTK